MSNPPKSVTLSVAICTSGRETLVHALRALERQTRRPDELVIVNQGAALSESDLRSVFPGVIRLTNQNERGLSRARNEACRLFTTDWLLWTDDDCEPNAEWVSQMEMLIQAYPNAGYFGGSVLAPLEYDPVAEDVANINPPIEAPFNHETAFWQSQMIGANFALSRKVIDAVGIFDVYLGAGSDHLPCGEETDYLMRALRKGFEGVCSPRPAVYHTYGKRERNAAYGYGMSKGSGGVYWKMQQTGDPVLAEYGARVCPYGPKRALASKLSGGLLFKDQLNWQKEYEGWAKDLATTYTVKDSLLQPIIR